MSPINVRKKNSLMKFLNETNENNLVRFNWD